MLQITNLSEKWVHYFFLHARCVATLSRDPSTKVGAVIVNPTTRAVVATGYNGFPRGISDAPADYNDRETKLLQIVHAELNAILNAAANGAQVSGCVLFVTLPPCMECTKAIIQSGIIAVYFCNDPDKDDSKKMNGGDLGNWRKYREHSLRLLTQAGVYHEACTRPVPILI